jgi:hypothetical protein
MWALLLAQAALATCTGSKIAVSELRAQLDAAERAYVDLDEDAFRAAEGRARAEVECLAAVVSQDDAAAWHRVSALAAFLDGDEARALRSLQAAARLAGSNAVPGSVAPPGTELRKLVDKARAAGAPATRSMDVPAYIDGAKSTRRPATVPVLLQYTERDGSVRWSGALEPEQEPPALAASPDVARAGGPKEVDAGAGSERFDTRRGAGMYYGFEVGLPLGARIDYRFDGGAFDSAGARLGLIAGASPTGAGANAAAMLAADADLRLSESWHVEFTVGAAAAASSYGYVGGAAIQFDPPSLFQLNLGLLAGYWPQGIFLYPDVTAGFSF